MLAMKMSWWLTDIYKKNMEKLLITTSAGLLRKQVVWAS